MAKVIKFNLRCDGNPVRTIEDLQENFSLEDVLSYYDNKLLHKWLSVRGYEEELEKVNAITSDAQGDIIKSLANIFEIDEDPATLDEKITILNYERDKRNIFEKAKESGKGHATVVSNYFSRYEQLVQEILELEIVSETGGKAILNDIDYEKIRNNFLIISSEFVELFRVTYKGFLSRLLNKNVYAIAFLLENAKLAECLPVIEGVGCQALYFMEHEYSENYHTYSSLMEECDEEYNTFSIEKIYEISGNILNNEFIFERKKYNLEDKYIIGGHARSLYYYRVALFDSDIKLISFKKYQNECFTSKEDQLFLEIVQNANSFWISFLEV